MKLEKLARIRDHRIFSDFIWPVDLNSFTRFNLIYGWNGSGKTTMSGLFRLLESRGPLLDGQVDFVVDGNRFSTADLAIAHLPVVRVFNRDTVSRSVFEGGGSLSGQLPPVYVFGEDSADKQRQVEDLESKIPELTVAATRADSDVQEAMTTLSNFAQDRAREIKNLLVAPSGSFNNYNAGNFRADVFPYEVSQSSENTPPSELGDEERQNLLALKDAKPLAQLSLPPLSFPEMVQLHNEARDALEKTVVSSVIQDIGANPSVAAWVRAGLELHTPSLGTSTCKFCDQALPTDRLRRLEEHFNDRYKTFVRELSSLSERISSSCDNLSVEGLPASSLLYQEFAAEYESARKQLESSISTLKNSAKALASAVQTKKDRAFESLTLESLLSGGNGLSKPEASFLMSLVEAFRSGLPAISEFLGKSAWGRLQLVVEKHNQKTSSFSQEVKSARAALHRHEVAKALPKWLESKKNLVDRNAISSAASIKKREVENKIRELKADILQHRRPADEINRDLISYLGHSDIQLTAEETGYRLTRRGVTAGHLSEGEKTAIAFLHFLKSLDDQAFDINNGVVVIDDPISSLDTNSTYSAFGFMKDKLRNVGQLFVFTHNFTFFRQVRNWFGHLNRGKKKDQRPASFYMLRASIQDGLRSSKLTALDPFLQDYESEYHYLFKRILEVESLPSGLPLSTYYEIPNLARRLLESFLTFKIPDRDSLHAKIEAVTFDDVKKIRILRFVDTHSHAEQVGGGHDEPSAIAEAPEVVRDLIGLIEACDSDHVRRMREALVW